MLLRALIASLAALAACSSDDAPAPGGADASTVLAPEAGPPPDAAAPRDAATDAPPGPTVECTVGGEVEVEPNDTPATATPFRALDFCGVLSTGADVDHATFTTPPGTKLGLFQAIIDGKVQFELTLNGATFGPGETSKFGSGTYDMKAFTSAGAPATYSVRVQFDPQ
ncbi:MAG: hypothetical protein JWP97_3828 [Labilithrix sp.]|nr:hypothetical protein [Labilithrix sp.]